jgi:hypothetical protein
MYPMVACAYICVIWRKTWDQEKGTKSGQKIGWTTRVRCVSHALLPLEDTAHRAAPCRPFYDRTFIRHFEPLNVRRGISSLIYRDVNTRLFPIPFAPRPPHSSYYTFAGTGELREKFRKVVPWFGMKQMPRRLDRPCDRDTHRPGRDWISTDPWRRYNL